MKSILLIGLGRFGMSIAEKLNELDHEVMAVDRVEKRVNDALPLVTDAQIGNATSEAFLRSLGVDNYDVCFVTVGKDFQSSLEIVSLLKELGARKVVARAGSGVHRKFLLRNGADEVVYPEKQLADWVTIRYTTDRLRDFIALDSEYGIYDLAVPAEWNEKTVGSLDIRKRFGLNLLAVREKGGISAAVNSETLLRTNETVLVLGKWKDIQRCFKF